MPFKKDRNSRDDKSGNDNKKSFKKASSDTFPSTGKYGSENNSKKYERNSGKSYGEGRRSSSYKDAKPDSEKRSYGNERKDFIAKGKKRAEEFSRERKERSYNEEVKKKPFKSKSEEGEAKTFSDDKVRLRSRSKKPLDSTVNKNEPEFIRLNRYIANSGICSRRKADELIETGTITVNDEVVTELGTKVNVRTDKVKYNGQLLKREKMVYVLLNKPRDFITTTDDPQERKTVMELVKTASSERIYPVGRLDRNTTGLLLLTNDGDLAEKLSHPRNNVTKIYNVELNKNLTQGDFNKIAFGIELEDGFIKPDALSYVTGGSKREVGIQIHSGKN
ncbi:rRNA pseudouridine synthase, partial [Pseudoxanthomonas sp. SGD-10]